MTRRLRGLASVMRTRWAGCWVLCWGGVLRRAWSTWRSSRSTARRSTRNASERATRDYEQLARELLAEADAVDAEEDERLGARRGDELPEPLGSGDGRARWLADARRRLKARRAEQARPIPAARRARLREARRRLEEAHRVEAQANADYEAYRARGVDRRGRRFGRPPKRCVPPATPQGKINTTDFDS